MYNQSPEDRTVTNESGSQFDSSICEQSQVQGSACISFPFIKEENADSNTENESKKHKKRKKGAIRKDDAGISVFNVKRDQICQSSMMIGHNQQLSYCHSILEEDEMIAQKNRKKKKKHKSPSENLQTLEDTNNLDSIKKEQLNMDEAANCAKKMKKKKKKKSKLADDETRNGILRKYVENTRQYSTEIISGMAEIKSKVKHKKSHHENSSNEKANILPDNMKESRMNEIGLNVECEENQNNFDPRGHEKKKVEEKKRKKEKKKKKEKSKETNSKPQRSDNMRSDDPKEENSEKNGLTLLKNAKINIDDIGVKKRKSSKITSYKSGDIPSQIMEKEMMTQNEITAMHTDAMIGDASSIEKRLKRKHWQSDESISLELKESIENMKKGRLEINNLEQVGMQNLEDNNHNDRKRKKSTKHHSKRPNATQEPISTIENKHVDNRAALGKAQKKLNSTYSSYENDGKKNEMKIQRHRERSEIIQESTKNIANICDSTGPDFQNSIIELKSQKSNKDGDNLNVLTSEQEIVGNFKDNELLVKEDQEIFKENCYTPPSSSSINNNVLPRTRRKRKVDDNSVECEGGRKSLRKVDSHRNSNGRLGKMSGNKLGECKQHRTKSKENVASNASFIDPVLQNTSRNLDKGSSNLKVLEYRLKWHLSAEDKDELKKQGVEFEKGRWRAEEIKKLEDNFQSILTHTGMTNHDLVKLIEDKSSEAKRRRTDLGIYHILLEGINRPIKLVHQKLKKLCDPNHFKGKWLKTEEELLLKLYKKHGNDWTKIGELMGRSKDSVIHKIQRLLCGPVTKSAARVKNTSRWTEDEINRLSKAVEKITNNGTDNNEKKIDSREIDWSIISGAVKTRSAESCRFKWVFDLSLRDPGTGKKNWTTDQNIMFLEKLNKCGKKHEKDVDWAQILQDLNLPGNVPILKRKWKFYRLLVPHYEKLNFEQQLDWLTRNFIKRVRERRQYTEVMSEEQGY